jgi:hypothetical protein
MATSVADVTIECSPFNALKLELTALGFTPCEQINQDQYDGDHQQQMDKSTNRDAGHQTQNPQNNKDNGNRVKHGHSPMMTN